MENRVALEHEEAEREPNGGRIFQRIVGCRHTVSLAKGNRFGLVQQGARAGKSCKGGCSNEANAKSAHQRSGADIDEQQRGE